LNNQDDKVRRKAIEFFRKIAPGKIDRIGEENLGRLLELFADFEEIRGTYGFKEMFGPRFRVFFALSLALVVLLTWWLHLPGFFSGLILAVAFGYLWEGFRTHFAQRAIHLGGSAGYAASRERTRKHRGGGAQQHMVARERGMFALYYFVYSKGSSRWSWRPFALLFLIVLSLFFFPLLGVSIVLLVLSVVVNAGLKLNTPVALFLGPSTPEATKLFWKVRFSTGIPWASLLRDPIEPLDEMSDSVDDIIKMMPNYIYSNPWSLRLESNPDWMTIVSDYIEASTVIVIKAADVPAVRNELDLLANSFMLERVIVIDDPSLPTSLVPAGLRPAVMSEDEASRQLALIMSDPGRFRSWMQQRAGLFQPPAPFASG
jgi:hypothetical protein